MPHDQDIRVTATRYGPFAIIAAVLVWHVLQYSFVTDDAFISFVFSRNLAEHGELTFNLGQPVEGYTNFLWTFLLGLLMLVGLAPGPTSLVLGTGFALGTLWVAFRLVEYLFEERSGWDYVAPALLALSAGYACWASGGLETQMFTFWVALAIYAYVRGDTDARWLRVAGVALALAAMTRPEGLLVTAIIGVHRLAMNIGRDRRWLPNRDELWFAGLFLCIWGPWYAWRWWYYGYPFPNTYYVKAAGKAAPRYHERMRANGLHYVWVWARQTGVVWLAPLIVAGALVAKPRGRVFYFGSLALPLAAVYLLYAVRVGGDFMGLHRFIMPVFFLAAVGVVLGLRLLAHEAVWSRVGVTGSRARMVVATVLALAVVVPHAVRQLSISRTFSYNRARLERGEPIDFRKLASDGGIDTPLYLWMYTHDRAAIGKRTSGCFRADQFSIVGGAGAQPYFARMRGIDVFGLVSRRIAHEVPRTNPRAGHNKWGPNALLRSYDPDFVLSCYSLHPAGTPPRFNCDPGYWNRNGYVQVTVEVPDIIEMDPGTRKRKTWYTFWRHERVTDFRCKGLVNR